MYENGYRNIVNVDYSSVVIDKMRTRWRHLTGMEWIIADIQNKVNVYSDLSKFLFDNQSRYSTIFIKYFCLYNHDKIEYWLLHSTFKLNSKLN